MSMAKGLFIYIEYFYYINKIFFILFKQIFDAINVPETYTDTQKDASNDDRFTLIVSLKRLFRIIKSNAKILFKNMDLVYVRILKSELETINKCNINL